MHGQSAFWFTIDKILRFHIIPGDKQTVGLAADLTVFHVLLRIAASRIYENRISLKAIGTSKITIHIK